MTWFTSCIPGSMQPLSSEIVLPCTNIASFFEPGANCAGANPAEVKFGPDGKFLVVSDRLANQVRVYTVDENGMAGGPHSTDLEW
ncbi:MAG TPA: beta-propeller fold lactonase family protein [Gammaproteobacteria bacterium]|jgi:hypothetical protein|nr:beta-propeller fold lactonase family protein [Gammaproteobacteria bacterium]